MSRNRPRPRDNGFGNNEELELWTKICQDIRKSKDKFDQQTTLSLQIKALVDKITNDGNSEYILTPAFDPPLYTAPSSNIRPIAPNDHFFSFHRTY
jgi:hypothetical protein